MFRLLSSFRPPTVAVVTASLMLVKGCGVSAEPRAASPVRTTPVVVRVPIPTTTTALPPPVAHFSTLPVGAALPSDATCAALVRPAAEVRPGNAVFNRTKGNGAAQSGFFARVDGDFAGTTDEIIQWEACKWGIDEDIVRAQTYKESSWNQSAAGDFTTDSSRCVPGHPPGTDGRSGQCPESIGLMQVRYPYWGASFPMATNSSAYNLDEALAARRSCFEGNETWLNTVGGNPYSAGDLWGCVGLWFAGRWHTAEADTYVTAVQDILNQRVWQKPGF